MSADSYPITVWSGILSPDHYRRIGPALWEFLWLIDRTTTEEQDDTGETWGLVLGGRPVRAEECAADLGKSPESVLDSWRRLELTGYIQRTRAPYGYVIRVRRSKKWRRSGDTRPTENAAPGGQQNPGPGDQENRRVGDQENRRIGESESAPTLRISDSPGPYRQGTDHDKALIEEEEEKAAQAAATARFEAGRQALMRFLEHNRPRWYNTRAILEAIREVATWPDWAPGEGPWIVLQAAQEAVKRDKDSWKYAEACLDRWRSHGYRTLAQVEAAIERWNRERAEKQAARSRDRPARGPARPPEIEIPADFGIGSDTS